MSQFKAKPFVPHQAPPGPHPITSYNQTAPAELIHFYEHEMVAIDSVLAALSAKQGHKVDLEAYRQEIISRFADIGFVVDVAGMLTEPEAEWVKHKDTSAAGMSIVFIGRTESFEFDHERQAYEIIKDIANVEPDKKDTIVDANGNIRSAPKIF